MADSDEEYERQYLGKAIKNERPSSKPKSSKARKKPSPSVLPPKKPRQDLPSPGVHPNIPRKNSPASGVQSNTSYQNSPASGVQPNNPGQGSSTSGVHPNISRNESTTSGVQPNTSYQNSPASGVQLNKPGQGSSTSGVHPNISRNESTVSGVQPNIFSPESTASGVQPNNQPEPSPTKFQPQISHPEGPIPSQENHFSGANGQLVWTLFKCTKCLIHFTMGWKAVKHLKFCHTQHQIWQCEHCLLTIAESDQEVHRSQHRLGGGFSTIDVGDDISPKLIYKCIDSGVCFDKMSLISFTTKDWRLEDCQKCTICDLVMHRSAFEFHERFHKQFNLQSTYFITVNITHRVIQNTRIRIYQCSNCSQCSRNKFFKYKHKCPTTLNYKCDKCQLYFCNKRDHETSHKDRSYTRDDLKLITFSPNLGKRGNTTNDALDEEISNPQDFMETTVLEGAEDSLGGENRHSQRIAFMCSECNVCFITEESATAHANNHTALQPTEYIQCDICSNKFVFAEIQHHKNSHLEGTAVINNVMKVKIFRPYDNIGI